MKKYQVKTALLAILACLLWSTAAPVIKIGLHYAKPLFFAGIRFLLAGIILIPFSSGFAGYRNLITKQYKTVFLVSLFQTILLYVLFFEGINLIPGAVGSIINGSSPLAAAVLSHFFRTNDKLNLPKILKILLGITGVIFITVSREPLTGHGSLELLGIFLVFASCLCSATGNILVAGIKEKIHPISLNSMQIGLGGIVLILLSFIFEGVPVIHFTLEFIVALLWLSLVSAVGFSLWFYLLNQDGVKVSELNIWKFILPVFGAIISWVLLPGESPHWTTAVGMLLVAVSVLIISVPRINYKKQPAREQ